MSEIDPNAVVASVTADLIKSAFLSVVTGASDKMKSAWAKIFEDFSPYAERTHRKLSNVRVICVKDKDVPFSDLYVGSLFSCSGKNYSDEELIYKIRENKNVVVSGDGGSGKTFFMRKLWLTLFENTQGRVPLFVELRGLNDLTNLDLSSFIRASISQKGLLTDEVYNYFCEKGRFIFVLDGFDETAVKIRDRLQQQIIDLADHFNSCVFVVSSRPDSRFAGWQGFDVFSPQPFDLPRVKQLISAVPFDAAPKADFSKRLDENFYREHRSFLSNPLLAVMMLMTFRENMEIPKQMSIFYEQAFTTLFTWHDVTKAFRRDKSLDIDAFRKCFGAFCLITYYEQKVEFSVSDISRYIRLAKEISGVDKADEQIIRDFVESVNLLRAEGILLVFIHRSFQEYFAASALTGFLSSKIQSFLPSINLRFRDSVLSMMWQMNKELIVREYLRPMFHNIRERFPSRDNGEPFGYLARLSVVYDCDGNSVGQVSDPDATGFLESIAKLSQGEIASAQETLFGNEKGVENIVATLMNLVDEAADQEPDGETADLAIILKFTPDDIAWSTAGVPSVALDALEANLEDDAQRLRDSATVIEAALRGVVSAACTWCQEQFAESETRSRSLDEILGIGSPSNLA